MKVLAGVIVSIVAFPFLAYLYLGFALATSVAIDDPGRWWWQILFYAVIMSLTILDGYLGVWTYRCLDRRCHE